MLLDIVIRAIAIARIRGCGWWLMGAFWGTLFQVAVAPVQWAMAKGHTIGKTVTYQMTAEAARLEMEDSEAQRLTIEEVDGPSAPKMQLNNLELVQRVPQQEGQRPGLPRSHRQERAGCEGQLDNGRHKRGRGEQQRGSAQILKLLGQPPSTGPGSVRIYLILFCFERGFHSRTEIGEREINGSTVHNECSEKQDINWLSAPPPPLHNLIRGVIWSSTSLSPLSHLAPPPAPPCPVWPFVGGPGCMWAVG
jgi:hypothetical protein